MKNHEPIAHEPENEFLGTADGLRLKLWRHTRPGSESSDRPVLLLHGASACAATFEVPARHSLIDFLLEQHCDVWTLDWRSSWRVVQNHATSAYYDKFTFDAAADHDLPRALERIQEVRPDKKPVGVFGHCMGAGTAAMAIGAGKVKDRIKHVVLSTLGLYYAASWDGWIKAEDRLLQRIRAEEPKRMFIDSDTQANPWPNAMDVPYQNWPDTLLPPKKNEIFRRLAFMFGPPYRSRIVPASIHNEGELRRQFGPMHLKLYIQCAQNVRRGFAACFDTLDDTSRYLKLENFDGVKLTLISGARNRLWHPDSIRRMHDWLMRGSNQIEVTKAIFENYAHQDLVWGQDAHREIYPTIAAGLGL